LVIAMNGSPFRSLSVRRLFPRPRRGKQALLATLLLIAAGCGGDGAGGGGEQTVRADGYAFTAPKGWDVRRDARTVSASDGSAAVSVTVFRLARPFRPDAWARAVTELDGVAARLATQLRTEVDGRSTQVVAGRRARVYTFADASDGTRRIAFLLSGRRELQLLCRWPADREEDGDAACRRLLAGFTLAAPPAAP
jgi:hypothetical protein